MIRWWCISSVDTLLYPKTISFHSFLWACFHYCFPNCFPATLQQWKCSNRKQWNIIVDAYCTGPTLLNFHHIEKNSCFDRRMDSLKLYRFTDLFIRIVTLSVGARGSIQTQDWLMSHVFGPPRSIWEDKLLMLPFKFVAIDQQRTIQQGRILYGIPVHEILESGVISTRLNREELSGSECLHHLQNFLTVIVLSPLALVVFLFPNHAGVIKRLEMSRKAKTHRAGSQDSSWAQHLTNSLQCTYNWKRTWAIIK